MAFVRGDTVCDKSSAVLTGYLRKEGANVRSWKLRYFTLLSGGVVLYFLSPDAQHPLGGFCLAPDCCIVGTSGVLRISSFKSLTATKGKLAATCGRVFCLKGDVGDLQAWEVALHNSIEQSTHELALAPPCAPPPFQSYSQDQTVVAAASGLSLWAQRSLQDNDYFKRVHLEKLRRLLLHDDIVVVVDWVALDRQGVDNVGALVYNTVLGRLADGVSVQTKKTREAIMTAWTRPILRFEARCEGLGVSIQGGEMVVTFDIERPGNVGSDLEKLFGSE